MSHRRVSPRFRARMRVRYTTPAGKERAGFTTDVSTTGLFVLATAPPPIGSRVHVEVATPSGTELQMDGRIAWARRGRPRPGALRGGFGLAIDTPQEDWFRVCAGLASGSEDA